MLAVPHTTRSRVVLNHGSTHVLTFIILREHNLLEFGSLGKQLIQVLGLEFNLSRRGRLGRLGYINVRLWENSDRLA